MNLDDDHAALVARLQEDDDHAALVARLQEDDDLTLLERLETA